MTVEAGRQLLHYRLLEKVGEGGMGVVWKARDTSLDRDVAIKLLSDTFAGDDQSLVRFEREAKLLASLNHPNVATVFGVHEHQGIRFLAMELVPGEDLSRRLARGRLSVRDAVRIARQIADGLEAAHERGVIHRDLKPPNIRVAADDSVKILDFGLAKSRVAKETPEELESLSPTMTKNETLAGVVLGTAPYMSPEQARGQSVDERSDIWSFGCVLWECLTGEMLFRGATMSDSIGAILHSEPDWARLPADTPSSVRRLLRRCLAKDSRQRLHHIADARLELEDSEAPPSAPAERSSTRGYKVAIAALAVGLAATLGTGLLLSPPVADRAASGGGNPLDGARFTKVTDFAGSEFDAAISPDGRFVAFVSDRDGPFEVFVGQLGTGEFRKLESGSDELDFEDARAPVGSVGFNHDGSEVWLGGGPWRRVRSVPLLGGPMRNFLGEQAVNLAWSPDGEQLVYHERRAGDPLFVADRNGAGIRLLLDSAEGTHQHYPAWSVDGNWIYLTRGRPTTLEMDLWRVRIDGEALEQLTHGKLDVGYPTPLDESTVLYSAREADGTGPWLWALDVESKVSRRASVGLEQYSSVAASADGRRLVATVRDPRAELWSVPILGDVAREGDAEPYADLGTTRALAPRFGGSSLFYLSSRGSGDGLWRYRDGTVSEIWRGSETALLEPAAVSRDGEAVALVLRRDDGWRVHVLSADGAELRVLSGELDARGASAWSPDGRFIASGGKVGGQEGLFRISVDTGTSERLADGESLNPVWSPDGNLIVYGGAQVNAVSPLLAVRPDGGPVELPEISVFQAGERMRFLPDGSGLVYMQGFGPSQDFWLLDLATMKSRRLTRLDATTTMRTFDVTPDGERIVFDRLSEESDIVMIELRQRESDPS